MCAGSCGTVDSTVQATKTMTSWEWDGSPQNKSSGSLSQSREVQASGVSEGRRSWDSPSSGGCEDKALAHKTYWNTQAESRELREKVKKYEGGGQKQWTQGESAEEDSKKKLDQRKKVQAQQMR